MVLRRLGRTWGGRRKASFDALVLAGCEDVDASAIWKESDTGESAACVGMNLGGVDIVERPIREDMDAFVSVDARCNIGAGFLEGASWDDLEVDEG
jgi:hypothetical protein